MFYHSNRDFDYDLISVPKTIVDRLKSTPAKHDSTVDSPINTLILSHNTQDMVNDRDEYDDVIIINNVPEVIVVPSDDAPNDDLPCVIANVKSEPLENEIQTSKTKHTVTPQNDFECKTMVIQIPKDTKDIFECHSDGNRIKDDEVICIDEIKREPDSEVAVESTHKNLNKITTHRRTQYVHGKELSNTQTVKATPEDITKSLTNIKKSMDITYKEMEFMKKYINHSSTNPEVDIERMLPLAFVKTKCSESPEVIQKIQKPNKIKKLRQYRPNIKQTLLTDVSRNSESDVKIEVIKSVDVVEKEKLITVDLRDIQLNEQKREEGRPADNNLDQITPKESEVSEPLKEEKLVETFVEVDIPWDAVPIKEESDPEMDLKLSDIRSLYHVDVNVSESEIDVKREINEFDLTGQSENWHQYNFAYTSQHSSDDEFENKLITISSNATLNTDDERNRTHRKMGNAIEIEVVADVHHGYQQQSHKTRPYSNAERQRRYRERRKADKMNACTFSQSSDVQPHHGVQINKRQRQSNAERQRQYRKSLREPQHKSNTPHTSNIDRLQNVDQAELARKRYLNKQRQSRFRARRRFESPSTSHQGGFIL
ncbi:unnamed protein product [Pieris macdunnoughi]|nr:unnamed protein product [Pieris macdunnoughi]